MQVNVGLALFIYHGIFCLCRVKQKGLQFSPEGMSLNAAKHRMAQVHCTYILSTISRGVARPDYVMKMSKSQ